MKGQDISLLSTEYITCPFKRKHNHILAMIDAFGMCSLASCQYPLVSLLNSSCIEREMAFKILPHLSTTKRPSLFAVETMDQLAFHPSSFPMHLHNHSLSNMAVLALGAMSATLRHTDVLLSERILAKLHRMTLPPDHIR